MMKQMQNFSLGKQIEIELEKFNSQKVRLTRPQKDGTIRYLRKGDNSYDFNQGKMVSLIDLYYNSQFEDGPIDSNGQRKMFLNVGKFRSLVASKQINIDTKDFKFLPDDYSDPWTAFFMQKDFREWAKDTNWSELLNECIEKLPRYGTIVLKKVGNKINFSVLQNIKNEQTARSLKESAYVIEEHPQMYMWEITAMKGWDTTGLRLRYDEQIDVHERYGYVPLSYFKAFKNKKAGTEIMPVGPDDLIQSVYCMGIAARVADKSVSSDGWHTFYLEQATCPYRETHWDRQHGRWMGIGMIEDLLENQVAINIVANLKRRSLHWGAKRIMQSTTTDMVEKNLVRDVSDGEVLEVGQNGQITQVDLSAKDSVEMDSFMNIFAGNADQKAFTYDIVTGSLASHTPYRLAIILAQAVASYYAMRKENLGLFLKGVLTEFAIPQFLRDMGNEERVVSMFADEPGFEALKAASIQYIKSEVTRISLLSAKPINSAQLIQVAGQFANVKQLFHKVPAGYYKDAKYKFDLDVTGEELDTDEKIKNLTALYQAMQQVGDNRATKVLDRILALQGVNIDSFGDAPAPVAPAQPVDTLPGGPGGGPALRNGQSLTPASKALPANDQNPSNPTG